MEKIEFLIEYLKIFKRVLKAYYKILFKSKKVNINRSKKQAYIFLASDYCNIGDIAITYAQREFLKNNLGKDYEIIEIEVEETYNVYRSIKKHINKNSIITIIGGGNTGNLYEFIDQKRRFILRKFRNNLIVSFPQTIFYKEDKFCTLYKKLFISACKKCTNLTLIAREKNSYNTYKSMNTGARVILTPDIVFSLNINNSSNINKKGVALVFRNDKEKSMDHIVENTIKHDLEKENIEFEYCDTCGFKMNKDKNTILKEYFSKIAQKELVITDRLHGMIIAYINNIPCIAFDNNTHKIKSTYDTWLQNQELVKIQNLSDKNIRDKILHFLKESKEYNRGEVSNNFEELKKIIKGENND